MQFDPTKPLDFNSNWCSLSEYIRADTVKDNDSKLLQSVLGVEAVKIGKVKQYKKPEIINGSETGQVRMEFEN